MVENPSFDAPPTTAVGEKKGKFVLIKGYRLVGAVAEADTTINIAKGSGIAVGDVIGIGKRQSLVPLSIPLPKTRMS